MRLTCLFAALLSGTHLLYAADAKSACGTASLCEREHEKGFISLFDGKTLAGWQGSVDGYAVQDGVLVCKKEGGGSLFTNNEYADFVLRLEYKLEPGGNNGVGIRAPLEGEPAFEAMEIQILDDGAPKWKNLEPVQYNGSIYGMVPAKRGYEKPPGEWNTYEITAKGSKIKVQLNGTLIVDADLSTVGPKRIHGHDLDGLRHQKGHIALCGHGDRVEFRNIRIKEL